MIVILNIRKQVTKWPGMSWSNIHDIYVKQHCQQTRSNASPAELLGFLNNLTISFIQATQNRATSGQYQRWFIERLLGNRLYVIYHTDIR